MIAALLASADRQPDGNDGDRRSFPKGRFYVAPNDAASVAAFLRTRHASSASSLTLW